MKSYETKLRINDNRFMRINSLLQNDFGEIPCAADSLMATYIGLDSVL